MKDKKKRNDIILIAVCLFAAVAAFSALKLTAGEGGAVVVTVSGDEWERFSLGKDTTVVIPSEGGSNTLVIEDGRAYVTNASCPDGLCEKMHAVKKNGESIVCLPNRVVITVVGGDDGVDLAG